MARSFFSFSLSSLMHLQRVWQISPYASCQSGQLSGRIRRSGVATSTCECRDHPRTAPAATTQRR
jgi:hypothetical protein